MHVLRPTDLFVDVGANIGSYSIMVASSVGSSVIAVEPITTTYKNLNKNIFLNELSDLIITRNIGLSSKEGELIFTSDSDTTNHVIEGSELGSAEVVQVITLDNLCKHAYPTILKVDCEGYELEVLLGGKSTLQNKNLLAVVLELNGSGNRYGFSDNDVDELMLDYGFKRYSYSPFDRKLVQLKGVNEADRSSQNILYLRDIETINARLQSATRFKINNFLI